MIREEVTFTSGGERCAGWWWPGEGPVVVMANGFSLTRHDGLPVFAEAFAAAGCAVLAFDHRHLGDSGGERRQRFRRGEQLEDWRNAIAWARTPGRPLVLWGFSFAGGHVITLAARDPGAYAAVLALCPFVDGLARALRTHPPTAARILPRSLADLAGRHTLIPVTARPGEFGAMTFPGEAEGFAAAVPEGSPWRNEISPGVFATVSLHRPVDLARRVAAPLWVGLGERDISVHERAVRRLARRAPRGELHAYPYDHFEPLVGEAAARVAADQVAFLERSGTLRP